MDSAAGMLNSNYLENPSHVEFPQYDKNYPESRQILILDQGDRILLTMINGEPLVSLDNQKFLKPAFLFGDAISRLSQTKPKKEEWVFSLDGKVMYLPTMTRDYPLSAFFHATHPRRMSWDLTHVRQGKPGKIIYKKNTAGRGLFQSTPDGHVTSWRGLLPVFVPSENSFLIQPVQMPTFANLFIAAGRVYPSGNPQFTGWLTPHNARWVKLSAWTLETFESDPSRIGLYDVVFSTSFGIAPNQNLLLALVERYNTRTGTFAKPLGEMGLALHEITFVSNFPMGEFPYEEYVPAIRELKDIARQQPRLVEVYQELMYHYLTCTILYKSSSGLAYVTKWMSYLFFYRRQNEKNEKIKEDQEVPINLFEPLSASLTDDLMRQSRMGDNRLETKTGDYSVGIETISFLRQAHKKISNEALLAGFLSLWLRRLVIHGTSYVDRIHRNVLWPTVYLFFGAKLGLLPAMVCRLNARLRAFTESLIKNAPNHKDYSRVKMPLTYLMGWLLFHNHRLMPHGPEDDM